LADWYSPWQPSRPQADARFSCATTRQRQQRAPESNEEAQHDGHAHEECCQLRNEGCAMPCNFSEFACDPCNLRVGARQTRHHTHRRAWQAAGAARVQQGPTRRAARRAALRGGSGYLFGLFRGFLLRLEERVEVGAHLIAGRSTEHAHVSSRRHNKRSRRRRCAVGGSAHVEAGKEQAPTPCGRLVTDCAQGDREGTVSTRTRAPRVRPSARCRATPRMRARGAGLD